MIRGWGEAYNKEIRTCVVCIYSSMVCQCTCVKHVYNGYKEGGKGGETVYIVWQEGVQRET